MREGERMSEGDEEEGKERERYNVKRRRKRGKIQCKEEKGEGRLRRKGRKVDEGDRQAGEQRGREGERR